MTIIPMFVREMVAEARRGKLPSERRAFVALTFLTVAGPFAAWLYWEGGVLDAWTFGRLVEQALGWGVAMQGAIAGSVMVRGAWSIAKERESRTLDGLLTTDFSSAEIVLGKLSAYLAMGLSLLASGLPIMLLLHSIGGIDLRWVLLVYPAFAASPLFCGALAIWISAEMLDRRSAVAVVGLATVGWMVGPFFLSIFLPRMGIHLPRWVMGANWWLIVSSPVWIAYRVATGLRSWDQLILEIGRMIGLQIVLTALFMALAILRLRPAHRALAGIDRKEARRARRRLVWRIRPRPPVGDDPIFWREVHTTRETAIVKAITTLIWGGLTIGLAVATVYFAVPAFAEMWRFGLRTAGPPAAGRDANVFMLIFVTGPGSGPDGARQAFNLFLRWTTAPILLMTWFVGGAFAGEVLGIERAKGTLASLLATPMTAVEILRAAILAGIWRARAAFGVVLVLWGLGIATGALHPAGVVNAMLMTVAAVGMLCAFGALGSIKAGKDETASSQGLFVILPLLASSVLPASLPDGLNSVLWGAGCLPLMIWTALGTYREFDAAIASPLDAGLHWIPAYRGQMPAMVVLAWALAIVGPTLAGWRTWRLAIARFDRLVGRPHRAAIAPEVQARPTDPEADAPPLAVLPIGRGSPLAEADRAV